MIYGIGVDLVNIERIEMVIDRWGKRFTDRVFTPQEIAFCSKRAFPPQSYALRFAAKEAFSKAIGLGIKKGLRWKDIEVFHSSAGRPCLRLHGRASELSRKEQIICSHLSLSDEEDYGIAMVVLEKSDETGQVI
ncbi:MAG: holo-ACP synthase [Deltaproteobacteria bacterium]|nr:holo-ACP synthase [Deltaproteobacteria bacterium]